MLPHLLVATAMVLLTVAVHALCTGALLAWLRSEAGHRWWRGGNLAHVFLLGFVVAALTVAGLIEATAWALVYVWLGALSSLGEAVYFSLVTFTTLGYGDVTLPEHWRLLGALESASGIIIFGWTTALVVALLQKMLTPPDPGR